MWNKTEDLNIHFLNMISTESEILTKDISCECKCKFNWRKYDSNLKWNKDKSRCECKNRRNVKKIIFGILIHAVAKMVNSSQLSLTIRWLCVMKLYKEQKQFEQILKKEKEPLKTQNFYILLVFFLMTIALLAAISIYCYLIKYRAKQKHLLPFHIKNNKLTEVLY